jgi:hypothetical protein
MGDRRGCAGFCCPSVDVGMNPLVREVRKTLLNAFEYADVQRDCNGCPYFFRSIEEEGHYIECTLAGGDEMISKCQFIGEFFSELILVRDKKNDHQCG